MAKVKREPVEEPLSDYTFNNHVAVKRPGSMEYVHFEAGDYVPDWVMNSTHDVFGANGEKTGEIPVCDPAHWLDENEDEGTGDGGGNYDNIRKPELIVLVNDRKMDAKGKSAPELRAMLEASDRANAPQS